MYIFKVIYICICTCILHTLYNEQRTMNTKLANSELYEASGV